VISVREREQKILRELKNEEDEEEVLQLLNTSSEESDFFYRLHSIATCVQEGRERASTLGQEDGWQHRNW
jgi:Trp operon repressor